MESIMVVCEFNKLDCVSVGGCYGCLCLVMGSKYA